MHLSICLPAYRFYLAARQGIGERCFDEGMYEAARLLFKNIHNNAKLALCLVHLSQYREAVEAATKANAVNTWKQVRERDGKTSALGLVSLDWFLRMILL